MRIFSFSVLVALMVPCLAAAQPGGLAVTQSAHAVERPENSLTLNVLPLLLNVIDVTYERVLTPELAVQLSGGFKFPEAPLLGWVFDETWAWKVGAGMRWYVAGHAPTGFFVNPGLQIFGLPKQQFVAGSGHLMLGGAWLVANRFHMSAGGGVQYLVGDRGDTRKGFGFVPAAQFSMGPAF